MNIEEVKSQLGYATLNLNYGEKDGSQTLWLSHWDNDNRISVSVHQETFEKIKADKSLSTLGIQTSNMVSETSKLPYLSKRIVMYTAPDQVL